MTLREILESSSRIVFFGGAGVSTESGIPDFRSEDGLYKAMSKYGHPPETMLSRSFFEAHTALFYEYYRENLIHADAKPGPAHLALAQLEKAGKLTGVVTQNIDGLHQVGGSENVLELHGSIARNYCLGCGARYELEYMLTPARASGPIPLCEICGKTVRPDVVLYEEPLDETVWAGAMSAIRKADTMIVGGTSLAVYPAAGLLGHFTGHNLILINKSKTPYDDRASLVIHDSIGKVLSQALA